MKILFAQKYLKELYELGKTNDKKHRFQYSVVKRYQKAVDKMLGMRQMEDMLQINSFRYERLHGDKKGLSSIRVSDKYRIEFEEQIADGEKAASICNIVELSNHYK